MRRLHHNKGSLLSFLTLLVIAGCSGANVESEAPRKTTFDLKQIKRCIKLSAINISSRAIMFGAYPEPRSIPKGGAHPFSWRVELLPFVEQKELYDRFNFDEPWNSEHNLQVAQEIPPFLDTGAGPGKTHIGMLCGTGLFSETDQRIRPRDVKDNPGGPSKVNLVPAVGMLREAVPWTAPFESVVDRESVFEIYDFGLPVANPDGLLLDLNQRDNQAIWALLTRDGGEKFTDDGQVIGGMNKR